MTTVRQMSPQETSQWCSSLSANGVRGQILRDLQEQILSRRIDGSSFDRMLKSNTLVELGVDELNPRMALSIRRTWNADFANVTFVDYSQAPAAPATPAGAPRGGSRGPQGGGTAPAGGPWQGHPGSHRHMEDFGQHGRGQPPQQPQWQRATPADFAACGRNGSVDGPAVHEDLRSSMHQPRAREEFGQHDRGRPPQDFGQHGRGQSQQQPPWQQHAGPPEFAPYGRAGPADGAHRGDPGDPRASASQSGRQPGGYDDPRAAMHHPPRLSAGFAADDPRGPPRQPGRDGLWQDMAPQGPQGGGGWQDARGYQGGPRGYGDYPGAGPYPGEEQSYAGGTPPGAAMRGQGQGRPLREEGHWPGGPQGDFRGEVGSSYQGRGGFRFDDPGLPGRQANGECYAPPEFDQPPQESPSRRSRESPDRRALEGPPSNRHAGPCGGEGWEGGLDDVFAPRQKAQNSYAPDPGHGPGAQPSQPSRRAQPSVDEWGGGLGDVVAPRQQLRNVAQRYAEQEPHDGPPYNFDERGAGGRQWRDRPEPGGPYGGGDQASQRRPSGFSSRGGAASDDSWGGQSLGDALGAPGRAPGPASPTGHGGPDSGEGGGLPPALSYDFAAQGQQQQELPRGRKPRGDRMDASGFEGQSLGDCFKKAPPPPTLGAASAASVGRGRAAPSTPSGGQDDGPRAAEIIKWLRALPVSHVPEKSQNELCAIVEEGNMGSHEFDRYVKEVPPEVCAPRHAMKLKAAWANLLNEAACREVAKRNLENRPTQKGIALKL